MDQKLRRLLYPVTAASMLLVMSGVGHAHAAQVQQVTKPNVTPHTTATADKANQPSNIKSGQQTQTAPTKPSVGQTGSGNQKITDQTKPNKGHQLSQTGSTKSKAIKDSASESMPNDGVGGQGQPGHTSETPQQYAQVKADYMKDVDQYQLSEQQKTAFADDAITVVHDYKKSKEVPNDPLWKDWLNDYLRDGDFEYIDTLDDINGSVNDGTLSDLISSFDDYSDDYNATDNSEKSSYMSPRLFKFLQISDTLTPPEVYSLSQQKYDLANKAKNMDSGMATVGIGDIETIPGGQLQGLTSDCPDGEVTGAIKDPYIPADLQAKIRFLRDVTGDSPFKNLNSSGHVPGTADRSYEPDPDFDPFGPLSNEATPGMSQSEIKRETQQSINMEKEQKSADKQLKDDYDHLKDEDTYLQVDPQVGPNRMGEYIEPYWKYQGRQINNWSGLGTGQYEGSSKPSGHPYDVKVPPYNAKDPFVKKASPIYTISSYEDLFIKVEKDYRLPLDEREQFRDLAVQAMGPFWDQHSSKVENSLVKMINQLMNSKYGNSVPGSKLSYKLPYSEFEDNHYFYSKNDWYYDLHDVDPVDFNNVDNDIYGVNDGYYATKSGFVSDNSNGYQSANVICQNILNDSSIPESFRNKFGDLYHYWTQGNPYGVSPLCFNSKVSAYYQPVQSLSDTELYNDNSDLQQIIGQKAYNDFKNSEAHPVNSKGLPLDTEQTKEQLKSDYLNDIQNYQLTPVQKLAFLDDAEIVVSHAKDYSDFMSGKESQIAVAQPINDPDINPDDEPITNFDPLWQIWFADVSSNPGFSSKDAKNISKMKSYVADVNGSMPKTLLKYLELSDTVSQNELQDLCTQLEGMVKQAKQDDSNVAAYDETQALSDNEDGISLDKDLSGALLDPKVPVSLRAKMKLYRDMIGNQMEAGPYESLSEIRQKPGYDLYQPKDLPVTKDKNESNADYTYKSMIYQKQQKVDDNVANMYRQALSQDPALYNYCDVGPENMAEYIEPYWVSDGQFSNDHAIDLADAAKKAPGNNIEMPIAAVSPYRTTFMNVERDTNLPLTFRAQFHNTVEQAFGPFWDNVSSSVEESLQGMYLDLADSAKFGQDIPGLENHHDEPVDENVFDKPGDQGASNNYLPVSAYITDYFSIRPLMSDVLVNGLPGTYQSENSICQHILADKKIPQVFRQKFGDLYNYWSSKEVQGVPLSCLEQDKNEVSMYDKSNSDDEEPDFDDIDHNPDWIDRWYPSKAAQIQTENSDLGETPHVYGLRVDLTPKAYAQYLASKGRKAPSNNGGQTSGSASGQSNSESTGSKSALKPSGSTSDSGSASKPSNSGASGPQSSSLPNGNSAASGSGETPNTNPMNSKGSSSSIPTSSGGGFEPDSDNTNNFVPTDSGDVNPDIPSVNPYAPNSVSPDNTTVNPITGDVTNPNAANTDGYTPVQSAETNDPSANTSSSPSVDNDGNTSTDTDNSNDNDSNLSPMDTDNNGNASSNLIKSSGMLGNNPLNTTAQAIRFSGMNPSNVMNTDSVTNNASIVSGNTDNQTTLPQTGEVSEDAYIALGLMLFSFGLVFDIHRRIS